MIFDRLLNNVKSEEAYTENTIRIPKDTYLTVSRYLKNINNDNGIIIVCIGTNHTNIIDCLGPFVGSILREDRDFNIPVYGSMVEPVHAANIAENMTRIIDENPGATIIAVDASLSQENMIGRIIVSDSPVYPGNGINKKCDGVGDYSIKGCVAPLNINICQYPCDLKFISAMAHVIARGIKEAYK